MGLKNLAFDFLATGSSDDLNFAIGMAIKKYKGGYAICHPTQIIGDVQAVYALELTDKQKAYVVYRGEQYTALRKQRGLRYFPIMPPEERQGRARIIARAATIWLRKHGCLDSVIYSSDTDRFSINGDGRNETLNGYAGNFPAWEFTPPDRKRGIPLYLLGPSTDNFGVTYVCARCVTLSYEGNAIFSNEWIRMGKRGPEWE